MARNIARKLNFMDIKSFSFHFHRVALHAEELKNCRIHARRSFFHGFS
jgi:hypothetical protein